MPYFRRLATTATIVLIVVVATASCQPEASETPHPAATRPSTYEPAATTETSPPEPVTQRARTQSPALGSPSTAAPPGTPAPTKGAETPTQGGMWHITADEAVCIQPLLPYKYLLMPEEAASIRDCTSKDSIRLITYITADTWPSRNRDIPTPDHSCIRAAGSEGIFYFQKLIEEEKDQTIRLEWALAAKAATTIRVTSCLTEEELNALITSETDRSTLECVQRETDDGIELLRIMLSAGARNALSRFDHANKVCSGEAAPAGVKTPAYEGPLLHVTQAEIECLRDLDLIDRLFTWGGGPPDQQEILDTRKCLATESLKLFTYMMDAEESRRFQDQMSQDTIDCMRSTPVAQFGFYWQMLEGKEGEAAELEYSLALLASITLGKADCLPVDHMAALGARPYQQAKLRCILRETNRGAEMAAIMLGGNAAAALGRFDQASRSC